MINDKEYEVIEELVQSPLSRYQIESDRVSFLDTVTCEFFFDCAHLLNYKCHNVIK